MAFNDEFFDDLAAKIISIIEENEIDISEMTECQFHEEEGLLKGSHILRGLMKDFPEVSTDLCNMVDTDLNLFEKLFSLIFATEEEEEEDFSDVDDSYCDELSSMVITKSTQDSFMKMSDLFSKEDHSAQDLAREYLSRHPQRSSQYDSHPNDYQPRHRHRGSRQRQARANPPPEDHSTNRTHSQTTSQPKAATSFEGIGRTVQGSAPSAPIVNSKVSNVKQNFLTEGQKGTKVMIPGINGEMITLTIPLSSTIAELRNYIGIARPDLKGKRFTLSTTFPQRTLSDDFATIENENLKMSKLIID